MGCCVTVSLPALLLQLSEGGEPVFIHGFPELSPAGAGAFRRLLEQGVLAQHEQLTTWDPCNDCDCGATERTVRWRDGRPFAACPANAAADTPLSPDMLRVYRVSLAGLAGQVAGALGLRDQPEEVVPSLWRLGRLEAGSVALLATTSAAARRAGTMERLKALDPGARFILIGSVASASERAALADRGISVVRPEDAFLPSEPALPIRIDRVRLQGNPAGGEPPLLTINHMGFTATFHGAALQFGRRDFRVLAVLVREASDGAAAARRDDLYRALTDRDDGEAESNDEQVDKSISRLRGALCDAAGLPRAEGTKLIVTVRGHGYRLDVPAARIHSD